jgi:hypothetical protein
MTSNELLRIRNDASCHRMWPTCSVLQPLRKVTCHNLCNVCCFGCTCILLLRLLQPLGNVTVINSTISRSEAWHNGGGLCTEMLLSNEGDSWDERKFSKFPYNLQTQLVIGPGTNFHDNRGAGRHLYVGPYFNLTFQSSTAASSEPLNATSVGVTWRKRICGKGEYAAPSGFCEQCAAFTYQMSGILHRNTTCALAPNNTHAPGGAVVVPLTSNWHMVCTNSTTGTCNVPLATSLRQGC